MRYYTENYGANAGIGVVHHLTLVHRDPHFTPISEALLPQMALPSKG